MTSAEATTRTVGGRGDSSVVDRYSGDCSVGLLGDNARGEWARLPGGVVIAAWRTESIIAWGFSGSVSFALCAAVLRIRRWLSGLW